MKRHLRVLCAREELDRCNIEVRRVMTSIYDEDGRFDLLLKTLKNEKSALLGPIQEYCTLRRRTNSLILGHIHQIFTLDGFTGDQTIGHQKGSPRLPSCSEQPLEHLQPPGDASLGGGDFDDEDINDGEVRQVDGLLDYITNL